MSSFSIGTLNCLVVLLIISVTFMFSGPLQFVAYTKNSKLQKVKQRFAIWHAILNNGSLSVFCLLLSLKTSWNPANVGFCLLRILAAVTVLRASFLIFLLCLKGTHSNQEKWNKRKRDELILRVREWEWSNHTALQEVFLQSILTISPLSFLHSKWDLLPLLS